MEKPDIIQRPHAQITGLRVQMPAGRYYLCDPCYCFNNDSWSELLEDTDFFEKPVGALKAKPGLFVCAFGTAHGDGTYKDNLGNRFGVDAGLIGLIPVAMADKHPDDGIEVEFEHGACCILRNGTLSFGRHTIDTEVYAFEDEDDD